MSTAILELGIEDWIRQLLVWTAITCAMHRIPFNASAVKWLAYQAVYDSFLVACSFGSPLHSLFTHNNKTSEQSSLRSCIQQMKLKISSLPLWKMLLFPLHHG